MSNAGRIFSWLNAKCPKVTWMVSAGDTELEGYNISAQFDFNGQYGRFDYHITEEQLKHFQGNVADMIVFSFSNALINWLKED